MGAGRTLAWAATDCKRMGGRAGELWPPGPRHACLTPTVPRPAQNGVGLVDEAALGTGLGLLCRLAGCFRHREVLLGARC